MPPDSLALPDLRPVLARLGAGGTLDERQAEAAFGIVMAGNATTAQIAGMVMAMRARGETVGELTGAVRAMRARMLRVDAPDDAIDVCGTGGDGQATLNVSTAVTFVLAGLGLPVAKHGNRAISSRAGAADVLAALGVVVDLPPERQAGVLRDAGCAFLFAPRHHAALRHAAAARAELGTRTIFNLLGPLANPAGVRRQLIGVFDPAWATPLAETLRQLGTRAAWVVHGHGLDELTLAGDSQVVALCDGALSAFTVTPEQAGLMHAPVSAIRGGDAAANADALLGLLRGSGGAYRDTVLLNAAAALVVAGRAATLRDGAAEARAALDDGRALGALERLRAATRAAAEAEGT